jgi:hypothetical protein
MMATVLAIRKAARIDSGQWLVGIERVSRSLPMRMVVPEEEIRKAARINNSHRFVEGEETIQSLPMGMMLPVQVISETALINHLSKRCAGTGRMLIGNVSAGVNWLDKLVDIFENHILQVRHRLEVVRMDVLNIWIGIPERTRECVNVLEFSRVLNRE